MSDSARSGDPYWGRALELVLWFVVAPPLAWWGLPRLGVQTTPIIPVLWVYGAVAIVLLARDPRFRWRSLVSRGDARARDVAVVTLRFAVLAAALAGAFALLRHQTWWASAPALPAPWFPLPRLRPGFWALLLVLYPLVSVVPQNLVWRAMFVSRYTPLFGGRPDGVGVALASAATFGWAHLVLNNVFAVVATVIGGWLFVRTYQRTRCLPLAIYEHALYGCWMFTVGFGWAFFPATPEMLERIGAQMRAAGVGL